MKKGAILYIVRLLAERFIGALLFYIAAGGFDMISGIFFALYIIIAAVSGIIIYKSNPETLSERGKVKTDSPKWDKVLLLIFWILAYFVIYYAAGKTADFGDKIKFDFIVGIVLYMVSAVITVKAMLENTFLESTARIQTDRNQTVIQTGPYSVVRHPTYSSILIWCVAIVGIFPSAEVWIISHIIALIIIIRTKLEDDMLKEKLLGYKEYSEKVKYRLIPFVW